MPGLDHDAVTRQLTGDLPISASGTPVTIRTVTGLSGGPEANIYGGDRLNLANGNFCTAGFTVQGATTRGILTAGHCGRIGGTPVRWGSSDRLTFVRRHEGDWGDFEWHYSTLNTHVGQFRSSSGLTRVTGTGTPTRGQRLCRHGQKTGTHCDDVSRWLNECEGRACRLVAMERYTSEGGDSGGPYFSGGVAYGIHYGWKYKEFCGGSRCQRSLFSQIRYVSNALGPVSIVRG